MRTSFFTTFGRSFLLFSLIAAPAWVAGDAGAAQIRQIEHKSVAPGNEEVRISFDEAVEPKIFTMGGGKPRVVLDFPDTTRAAGVRNLSPKSAVVKAVRVGVDKGRTRLVCDVASLKGLTSTVSMEGGQVVVSLKRPGAAAASAPATTGSEKAKPAEKAAAPEKPAAPERLAPTRRQRGPGADRAVLIDDPAEESAKMSDSPAGTAGTADKAASSQAEPAETAAPASPAAPAKAAGDGAAPPYLSAIQFDPDSPRGELVQFKLNGFYPPVLRSVESGPPQVICEFNNMEVAPALQGPLKLSGRLVKAIRLERSADSGKVRVFVELEPNKHYDLQQVFFKEENFFVLMVNTAKQ